ncbi:hypothetical protein QAD02_009603 [Eretmocerus hayati]|uniref:Uncharacterized protein n=1 Tax=Eretmocerus hayati TaxID=131215 RepID=A0ACC2N9W7_9HYME|nr:hypothetical protein QAD02_009603 [Eretmocerus hayati]
MDSSGDESEYDEVKAQRFYKKVRKQGEMFWQNTLPAESRRVYELTYAHFMSWLHDNKSPPISERLLIAYFQELSHVFSLPILWSRWSMISTLLQHGQFSESEARIDNLPNLKQFLKNFHLTFKTKNAVFKCEDIEKFLREADDLIYLEMKVILVFGICGGMTCVDMVELQLSNVSNMVPPTRNHQDDQNLFQYNVTITDAKKFAPRSFVIDSIYSSTVKDYIALRPTNCDNSKFFSSYSNGQCSGQDMEINRSGEVAKSIAVYLGLQNPGDSTGHSFRRTAAALHTNSRANMIAVESFEDWSLKTVAHEYIENSNNNTY